MGRHSEEETFPSLDFINDYLNINGVLSEIHQKLILIMQVSLFNGGKIVNNELNLKKQRKYKSLKKIKIN